MHGLTRVQGKQANLPARGRRVVVLEPEVRLEGPGLQQWKHIPRLTPKAACLADQAREPTQAGGGGPTDPRARGPAPAQRPAVSRGLEAAG
jgi:hypothetical protein